MVDAIVPRPFKKMSRSQEYYTFVLHIESLVGCPHTPGREYYIDWERGTHEGATRTAASTPSGVLEFNDRFSFVTGLYVKGEGQYMSKRVRLKICQRDVTSSKSRQMPAIAKKRDREQMNARKVGIAQVDLSKMRKNHTVRVECEGPSVHLRARVSWEPCGSESHKTGTTVMTGKDPLSPPPPKAARPGSVSKTPPSSTGRSRRSSHHQDVMSASFASNSTADGGGARRMTDASDGAYSERSSMGDWDSPQPSRRKGSAAVLGRRAKDDSPPADPEDLAVLRQDVGEMLEKLGRLPKREVSRTLHRDAEDLRRVYAANLSYEQYRGLLNLFEDVDDQVREVEHKVAEAEDRRAEYYYRQQQARKREEARMEGASEMSDEYDDYARPEPRAARTSYPSPLRKSRRGRGSAKHQNRICDVDCTIL
eukprot:Hpha_TRINITY_DN16405_c1_g6::TRINITY_DN16405_c1_g6_i1::g.161765::m.161765